MSSIISLIKRIKIKGDTALWVIILLLSVLSVLAVYSSSFSETVLHGKTMTQLLIQQILYVGIGWTVMIVCYYIPPYIYKRYSYIIYIGCCLLLVYAIAFGATMNNTSRWVRILGVSFQPSEFAKIGLVLYLSTVIDRFDLDNFKTYIKTVLIPVGCMLVLIMINSVSMTILLATVAACLLILNGLKWKFIWKTLVIAAVAILAIWGTGKIVNGVFDADISVFRRFDTVEARIERFLSPSEEEKDEALMTDAERRELQKKKDKEFQGKVAEIAIKSGGLTGQGPGHSLQRYILPQANSDFIFSVIIEEYGILLGIVILILYITIFIRCIRIANLCTRKFSASLVIGLGLAITLQAMVHMMVNVGLLPVTGQTLPLLSSGGTSFMVICCGFGIILSVSKAANDQYLSRKEKEKSLPIEVEAEAEIETEALAREETTTEKEQNK